MKETYRLLLQLMTNSTQKPVLYVTGGCAFYAQKTDGMCICNMQSFFKNAQIELKKAQQILFCSVF